MSAETWGRARWTLAGAAVFGLAVAWFVWPTLYSYRRGSSSEHRARENRITGAIDYLVDAAWVPADTLRKREIELMVQDKDLKLEEVRRRSLELEPLVIPFEGPKPTYRPPGSTLISDMIRQDEEREAEKQRKK